MIPTPNPVQSCRIILRSPTFPPMGNHMTKMGIIPIMPESSSARKSARVILSGSATASALIRCFLMR